MRRWTAYNKHLHHSKMKKKGDLRHVVRVCGTRSHRLGHVYKERLGEMTHTHTRVLKKK